MMRFVSVCPVESVHFVEEDEHWSDIPITFSNKTTVNVAIRSGQFKYRRDINEVLQCLVGHVIVIDCKQFTNPSQDDHIGWVKFLFDNQRITLQAYATWHETELYIQEAPSTPSPPQEVQTPIQLSPWIWSMLSHGPPIDWKPSEPCSTDFFGSEEYE